MKICVVSGIFHPEIGGPATHLYNLCFELVARGNQVAVITYGDIRQKENYPFFVKRISKNSSIFIRLFKFTFHLIKIGRNCDIFYVDHYGFPVVLANFILCKPTVIRITGDFAWEYANRHKLTSKNIDEFQDEKHSVLIELIRKAQYFYTRNADRVIVPSNYLKSIVENWGIPPHKIDIVYNGIREKGFTILISQSEARERLGINHEINKIILTVARLVPWKGIDMLIQILPRFNTDIKLFVIGEGPDIDRIKGFAFSNGVEGRVIFKGRIPHDEIGLYLKAADAFVLPSSYEGLPHTIIEAMMVGVPIAATNIGGIPELIENGKNGLLFNYGDLSNLEDSISKLLDDISTALKLVENSKEKVKQFKWDISGEKIIGILNSVVNNSKRNYEEH